MLLINIQLNFDGFLDLVHILPRESAGAPKKPCLAHGRQLICHGFAFFAFKNHECLTGIEAICLAGERDNLNSIEKFVGGIIGFNSKCDKVEYSPGNRLIGSDEPLARFGRSLTLPAVFQLD
jgi:hypothetical protein